MASGEDDSDLEALRLEVLASLKTRPQGNFPVKEGSNRPDAELENLRTAALQSKRNQDETLWASRGKPKRGFLSNRGYGRNFGLQQHKSLTRNVTNLIVIQPVPLEENSQQSSSASPYLMRPTDRLLNEDDVSQSPRQQRSKSSGKFSRFESDSDGDDSSSESELSESEETAKSQGSSAESGNKSEEESDNEENINDNDENVELNDILLLHAEEEPLQEIEDNKNDCETLTNTKTESVINDDSSQNNETNGTSAVHKSINNSVRGQEKNTDSHERRNRRRSRDRAHKDGRSRHRESENKDLRDHRFERIRHREGADEKHRKRNDDKNNRTKAPRKSVRGKQGKSNSDLKDRLLNRKSEFSRGKAHSPSNEIEHRGSRSRNSRDLQQNSRSISRESGRSPSPSTKSQPIWPKDLRQKLKSRSHQKEFCSEGEQKSGGNSQSDSEESLGMADRVKSVLGVVKLSSTEPKRKENFRTSRLKLETVCLPPTSEDNVRRKTHSPVRIKSSKEPVKTRKVLLVNDGRSFSDDEDIESKRTRINITLTEAPLDNEESSKQRVPVHLRLGSLPKASKSPSKLDSIQSSHQHTERGYRSSSPSFVTKATKRSKGDKGSDDPPRKVKLKRDAFQLVSTLSSSIQAKTNGFASKKSQNESGKTYENELDEKIRRIREQNQAILKRKYEIEEDEQVNY